MAGKPVVPKPGLLTIQGVKPDFTKNGKQVFKVQMSDGNEYNTFDQPAATLAQSLVNQPGTLFIEQNGQYENYASFQPGAGGAVAPPAVGFTPAASQAVAPPAAGFTPAPGFANVKDQEIRRAVIFKEAGAIIANVAGTGFYLNDEGGLDVKTIASDTLALTVALGPVIGPYLASGPQGSSPAETAAPEAPPLPPGVTPEQVQQWAAEQGAAVQVGAPVEAPAPATEEKPY